MLTISYLVTLTGLELEVVCFVEHRVLLHEQLLVELLYDLITTHTYIFALDRSMMRMGHLAQIRSLTDMCPDVTAERRHYIILIGGENCLVVTHPLKSHSFIGFSQHF